MRPLSIRPDDLRRCLDELPSNGSLRLFSDAVRRWAGEGSGRAAAASFHAVVAMGGTLLLGVVWDRSLSPWMALMAGGIAMAGASGAFNHLRRGLNAMSSSPALPTVFEPFLRTRVFGFGAVCASGLAAMALLAMATALPAIAAHLQGRLFAAHPTLALVHLALTAGLLGMLLGGMLRSMPDTPPKPAATQLAGTCGGAAMALATLALGEFLSQASLASPLDLAEAAIACVLWACWCAQCTLFAGALAAAIEEAGARRATAVRPARAAAPPPQRPARQAAALTSIAVARSRRAGAALPICRSTPCIVLRFPDRRR